MQACASASDALRSTRQSRRCASTTTVHLIPPASHDRSFSVALAISGKINTYYDWLSVTNILRNLRVQLLVGSAPPFPAVILSVPSLTKCPRRNRKSEIVPRDPACPVHTDRPVHADKARRSHIVANLRKTAHRRPERPVALMATPQLYGCEKTAQVQKPYEMPLPGLSRSRYKMDCLLLRELSRLR